MDELEELLNKVCDTYYDFVVGVKQYCKRSPKRLEKVLQYLKENPNANSSIITEFIFEQPDYADDIVAPIIKSKNVNWLIMGAIHSKNDLNHWRRYLSKFISEEGCRLLPNELKELISSGYLTEEQTEVLRNAVTKGTEEYRIVSRLRSKAQTPMVDYLREKYSKTE